MATLYTQAEANIRKTWFYLAGFFLLIMMLGWALSYVFNNTAILTISILISIGTSFFSYWYSDKIVLAMSQAKLIEKQDNPELYRLVENLCLTAGLPLPKIYIIDEAQPNAFATGRDPRHAVIAVTRGLLEKLERVELEGVIGHELSHIGNRDILLSTIVVILTGVVIRIADFFLRGGLRIRGSRSDREGGSFKLILFLFSILFIILAPLFATLLRLAISRKREFLADANGALLTRFPDGLIRALEKISSDPHPLPVANSATNHLYISDPTRGEQRTSWFNKLFMTHPPIEERIKALRGLKL